MLGLSGFRTHRNFCAIRTPFDRRIEVLAARRGYMGPAGEWNFQKVKVEGSTIEVELNGSVILDADLLKVKQEQAMAPLEKFKGRDRKSGHFGVCGHGAPIVYKDLMIRRIGEEL